VRSSSRPKSTGPDLRTFWETRDGYRRRPGTRHSIVIFWSTWEIPNYYLVIIWISVLIDHVPILRASELHSVAKDSIRGFLVPRCWLANKFGRETVVARFFVVGFVCPLDACGVATTKVCIAHRVRRKIETKVQKGANAYLMNLLAKNNVRFALLDEIAPVRP
jgi:hypothetical protein